MSSRGSTLRSELSLGDYDDIAQQTDSDVCLTISVDYGTTYTGAAWAISEDRPTTLEDINVVVNWPVKIENKVPSELTYSRSSGQRWGYGIGENAYVLRWTKLELPIRRRDKVLVTLEQAIKELQKNRGNHDGIEDSLHLMKTVGDIVTDYLREIAECVKNDIESKKGVDFWKLFPVDIVITHPVDWDDRAKNLTFKAVYDSFSAAFWSPDAAREPLRRVRLVTEPEACAHYAMKEAQGDNVQNLRKDECFIVVDAGGGTVDLVSYRVDSVFPNFRVTRITEPTGGRCGSIFVDEYFLDKFLPAELGRDGLARLRAFGGGSGFGGSGFHPVRSRGEQRVLKEFIGIKHEFAGDDDNDVANDNVLNLPGNVSVQGNTASSGQLVITQEKMKEMFQYCVDQTLGHIHGQYIQIHRHRDRLRPKAIFLSGGFSRSPYLQKRVDEYARSCGMTLICGQDSWSAVAKGALLMGLGVDCRPPQAVYWAREHIGVKLTTNFLAYEHTTQQRYTDSFDLADRARDNIKWVVMRGDLILHDRPILRSQAIIRKMSQHGNRRGTVVLVRNSNISPSSSLKEEAGQILETLTYDLNDLNDKKKLPGWELDQLRREGIYRQERDLQSGRTFERIEMQLNITATAHQVTITLTCGGKNNSDSNGRTGGKGIVLANTEWYW